MPGLVSMVLAQMTDTGASQQKTNIFSEKSWSIGIVCALAAQVVSGVWWAADTSRQLSSIETRLSAVEKRIDAAIPDQILRADKMARLDERDVDLGASIRDINRHLDAIESYLNTQQRQSGQKH